MGKTAQQKKKRARLELTQAPPAGTLGDDAPLSADAVRSACDTLRALLADPAALAAPGARLARTLCIEVAGSVLGGGASQAAAVTVSSKNTMHRFTKGVDGAGGSGRPEGAQVECSLFLFCSVLFWEGVAAGF
jgi:hypothetical protein